MALIPADTRLKVERQIEDKVYTQEWRPYLGISGIANPCPRALWYSFRWCSFEEITARLHRLFNRGHREEPIIQADLRSIGVIHHSDQKEVRFAHGHGGGHIDDILENVPDAPKTQHLGEYKTHNDKSFKELKKKGMIESKPMHHGQMICYMHLLGLKRGLYIAVNKNDDSRHYERVYEDPEKAQDYLDRAEKIISSEVPPEKIGDSTWWECKFCNHKDACHFGLQPLKHCRTCKHADLYDEGVWKCSYYDDLEICTKQQQKPCKNHLWLDGLIK